MIKFGDTKYFTLLDLQTKLKSVWYKQLPLTTYEKLQHEVDVLVEAIHLADKEERLKNKNKIDE